MEKSPRMIAASLLLSASILGGCAKDGQVLTVESPTPCWQCPGGSGPSGLDMTKCRRQANLGTIPEGAEVVLEDSDILHPNQIGGFKRVKINDPIETICWVDANLLKK